MKIKNMLNAHQFPYKGEMNFQPSMTVPDQAMSVREILQRYAQGLSTVGARVPLYDEDDDMPDMRTLDLSEREDLLNATAKELSELWQRGQKRQELDGSGTLSYERVPGPGLSGPGGNGQAPSGSEADAKG